MNKIARQKIYSLLLIFIAWGVNGAEVEASTYDVTTLHQPRFAANLYVPKNIKQPSVVIVLGGSSGGMRTERGEVLASNGIAALTLAYFRYEGLPDTLDSIPVESVADAIDYLQTVAAVDSSKVGIWGASRGTELAFLAASHDTRIQSVVATVPSQVAWHGANGETAWTYQQQPIKSLGFDRESSSSIFVRASQALEDKDQLGQAQFNFEKINGSVLLISAEQDQIWPSFQMANNIVAYLKKHKFKHTINHVSYPTGHFFDAVAWPKIYQSIVAHFKDTLTHVE